MSGKASSEIQLGDQLDRLVQANPKLAIETAYRSIASAGDPGALAHLWQTVGRALYELGWTSEASEALRRALLAAVESEDVELQVAVGMSAASVLAERGEFEAAHAELDRLALLGDAPANRGRLAMQRSYVLQQGGQLTAALDQIRDASSIAAETGDTDAELRLLVNRGVINLQLGSVAEAEADFVAALALAEQDGQHKMRAQAASNLAVLYGRMRRVRDAVHHFELAAELLTLAGSPSRVMAIMELDRAEAMMNAGLIGEAAEAARAAVGHQRESGNVVIAGDALLLLAEIELAAGRLTQAELVAIDAEARLHASGRTEMIPHARSVAVRAALNRALTGEAVEDIGSAADEIIEQLDANGWTSAADLIRLERLKAKLRVGEALDAADTLALRNRRDTGRNGLLVASLAEAAEHAAAGRFGDALAVAIAGVNLVDGIAAEAADLSGRSSAIRLGHDLSQLAIDMAISLDDAHTVFASAEGTRARALHDEVSERYRHRPLTAAGAVVLSDQVRDATKDHVFVEWVVSRGAVFAVVFHSGVLRLVEVGSMRQLVRERDRAVMWLDLAAEEPDASSTRAVRALAALADAALGRLDLPANVPITIAPIAELHGVPWSGLPSLAGRSLSVVPNAQLWLAANEAASAPVDKAAFVAGDDVAGTQGELAALQRAVPDVVAPAGGGPDLVRDLFGSVALLHIAAHGTFRRDHPLLSTLRLATGAATLYDTIPDRVRTRLVVLSSCEAGAHGTSDGAEVLGMAAVLLARGSASVLAPLTAVRELECADFVGDVYAELPTVPTVGEAVARVRARWLADDDLSRWAVASSFTLFGSTDVRLVISV